jgi:hypothetical protein
MANAMVPSNVPQSQSNVKPIDSISQVPYRIGYSFRQPKLLKPVTVTRMRPFFAMDWAIKGPSQVKEELYQSGKLQKFPEVWRRAAKAMGTEGLGVVGNRRELPSFNELGAAPGPTDNSTTSSTVSRDVFGFMSNLIKTTGGAIAQSQQLEITRAQAQAQQAGRISLPMSYMPTGEGIGVMGWAAIIGALSIGTFMYVRR